MDLSRPCRLSDAFIAWKRSRPVPKLLAAGSRAYAYFVDLYGDMELELIKPARVASYHACIARLPMRIPSGFAKLGIRKLLASPITTALTPRPPADVLRFVELMAAIVHAREVAGSFDPGPDYRNPFQAFVDATKPTTAADPAPERPAPRTPLEEAFELAFELRWRNARSARQYRTYVDHWTHFFRDLKRRHLDDITTADLRSFIRAEEGKGNTAIVRHKLSALRGVFREALQAEPPLASRDMPVVTFKRKVALKWWLPPEERGKLVGWLRDCGRDLMADYVEFVVFTGVRVEEALRLRPGDFEALGTSRPLMTVPGTKRAGSQATLPLRPEAAEIVARRSEGIHPQDPIFGIGYRELHAEWTECRRFLGVEGEATATLRNLRRSFARIATEKGMPTELLRAYLRHADIQTTAGYLKLVGGYDSELMRRFL